MFCSKGNAIRVRQVASYIGRFDLSRLRLAAVRISPLVTILVAVACGSAYGIPAQERSSSTSPAIPPVPTAQIPISTPEPDFDSAAETREHSETVPIATAATSPATQPDLAGPPTSVPVEKDSDSLEERSPDAVASIYRELNPDGPKIVDRGYFDQLLAPDSIEPIYTPFIGRPAEVDLERDDLVIGVSLGGESRAYPIRVLRFREMVNDELGGAPILVTW